MCDKEKGVFAVVASENSLYFWNVKENFLFTSIQLSLPCAPLHIFLHPREEYLFLVVQNSQSRFTLLCLGRLEYAELKSFHAPFHVADSTVAENLLVASGPAGELLFWDMLTGAPLGTITDRHADGVLSIAIGQDLMCTFTERGRLHVYRIF
ncbi:uncharacterized protein LOC135121884 [Zophobas morio]|uniref:uncharacterized protein LOC135121884 n=1 Tax=Zophobas morio TaxID=2755281 RepID=UPI003083A621